MRDRSPDPASTLPLVSVQPSELALRPIPGLFAVGCDAGGFSAHGYMGGLATALVTGLIAGRLAATRYLTRRSEAGA